MSISKRLTIAWDGSAPYEDTDTLVLTGRTYFVDVRVKKGSDPPSLDWAIAGTRTSRPGANPGEVFFFGTLKHSFQPPLRLIYPQESPFVSGITWWTPEPQAGV